MAIPDGSAVSSQASVVMAIAVQPITLHRVIVTNVIAHELIADLVCSLSHARKFAILLNHTCVVDPISQGCETWTSYIYDDSDERNVGPSHHDRLWATLLHPCARGRLAGRAPMGGGR